MWCIEPVETRILKPSGGGKLDVNENAAQIEKLGSWNHYEATEIFLEALFSNDVSLEWEPL
jgi:hypothetical protein